MRLAISKSIVRHPRTDRVEENEECQYLNASMECDVTAVKVADQPRILGMDMPGNADPFRNEIIKYIPNGVYCSAVLLKRTLTALCDHWLTIVAIMPIVNSVHGHTSLGVNYRAKNMCLSWKGVS